MLLLGHDLPSRQYVLDRLDRDHIRRLAEQAKVPLREMGRTVELTYMPGDATWYSIVIAPVSDVIGAPGGGHLKPLEGGGDRQSYIGANGPLPVFMIAHAQSEKVVFCGDNEDWEWIAQKFDTTEASQLAIAELLYEVFSA